MSEKVVADPQDLDLPRPKLHFKLIGHFSCENSDGVDVSPRSKKSRGLLAFLITANDHRSTRKELQSLLWSERGDIEAATSLRQSLAEIRRCFGELRTVLHANRSHVWLEAEDFTADIHDEEQVKYLADIPIHSRPVFLEELVIRDPAFCDWQKHHRQTWQDRITGPKPVADNVVQLTPPTVKQDGNFGSISTKPLVAVLPFSHGEKRISDDYFTVGLAQDFVDHISQHSWLDVLSTSTTFMPFPDDITPIQFAERIGAEYLISGATWRGQKGLAISIELSRVETGTIIWRKRFPVPSGAAGSLAFELAQELVGALVGLIGLTHQQLADNTTAADAFSDVGTLVWKGKWHLQQLSRKNFARAREAFEKAAALDPSNPEILTMLAWCDLWSIWYGRGTQIAIRQAASTAQKAIALQPMDARPYWILGVTECWSRKHTSSIKHLQRSLELCPTFAFAHAQMGTTLIMTERVDEGIKHVHEALRLSPMDPQKFHFFCEIAVGSWMLGHYQKAVYFAEQSINQKPNFWYAHLIMASALDALGQSTKAEQTRSYLAKNWPSLQQKDVDWIPFENDKWNRKLGLSL